MDIIRSHSHYQQQHPQKQSFHVQVLIIPLLLISLLAIALWVQTLLSPYGTLNDLHAADAQTEHIAAYNDASSMAVAQSLAQHYMQAFRAQHYQEMWLMLDPKVQAQWANQNAFSLYWKHRFQGYTLTNVSFGVAYARPLWVNPETMQQYTNVIVVPVSLQLRLQNLGQATNLPPEDVHPDALFQHLPFVVQHVHTPKDQWFVIAGGPADLEAPLLAPLTPTARIAQVPILMYHHISDVPTKNVLDLSLTVTPTAFSQQLDYLQAHGYHSITFNQLFDALYYGMALPTKPIILTFDDGYEDNYTFAYPILVKHGYSGMFYIITGKVGWDGQMTWNQLSTMLTHGMQMGSHTVHHVNIGQVLLNSYDQAQQELQISQSTLQQKLGIVVQHFCYPSGEPFRHGSLSLQQAVMSLLAQDGYIDATTDPGMTGINQQSQHPFILLRTRVDGRELFSTFESNLPW